MNETPISQIEVEINKNQKIVVSKRNLPKVINQIVETYGRQELINFKEILLANMIKRLRQLPPSKQYGLSKYTTTPREGHNSDRPLRHEIIEAIETAFNDPKFSKEHIRYENGKCIMNIKITHPLIIILNDGTGIFNKKRPHIITPTTKTYMFIPGDQYARGYYMRKYSQQGISKFEAEKKYQYHVNRMTHMKAIREHQNAIQNR